MRLRFLRFNVVGALGVGVQLGTAALLVDGLGLHYLVGTALAIEAAVVHNFLWHRNWTWAAAGRARREPERGPVLFQCAAFHAGNGLTSMVGTMAILPWLVGALHGHYLAANLVTICATGVFNFLLGDRLIFGGSWRGEAPGSSGSKSLRNRGRIEAERQCHTSHTSSPR